MSDRRRFLVLLSGASCATALARASGSQPSQESEGLARALRELDREDRLGIAADDFDLAVDYAVGAHREAAATLRTIVLDDGLDLPVAFAAKRGRS